MTDVPVDLDELERGATQWERGEILASGVVSPTLLRMIARELRAARAPVEAGAVTREHRVAALETWAREFGGRPRYFDVHCGQDYADTGDMRGILPVVPHITQAIADAEARGAARAVSQEASELKRCLRTGNPCGTDSVMAGYRCPCASCAPSADMGPLADLKRCRWGGMNPDSPFYETSVAEAYARLERHLKGKLRNEVRRGVAELETAESFYLAVIDPENDDENCVARIEARDKAVALRAKRELLDELIGMDDSSPNDLHVYEAVARLRAKYQEKP